MEQYLQELDKINKLLVFTDKHPFQLWTFFANNFSFILLAILITGIITKCLYEYTDWDKTTFYIILFGLAHIFLLCFSVITIVFSIIERFHTPVYDEFHVTKESYVDASNYLGNLSDEDFLKLYDQSLRYELQDSQKEQYESSARIVKQYYENHRYNIYKK
jgi:hypothetical protein